jgi:hypothetical protein
MTPSVLLAGADELMLAISGIIEQPLNNNAAAKVTAPIPKVLFMISSPR